MGRFLLTTPFEPTLIVIAYLLLVYQIGPRLMQKCKAFYLKYVLIAYNLLQIYLNVVISISLVEHVLKLSIFCSPPTPYLPTAVNSHYAYFLLKTLDLVESVFFILRKKWKQLSFLHIYHHVGVFGFTWVSCKYFPGGQLLFAVLQNTLVHVVMYSYYLLTCLNLSYGRNVWWKKYITLLQIIHQCSVVLIAGIVVFNQDCAYPRGFMAALACYTTGLAYFFISFYIDNYVSEKSVTNNVTGYKRNE